MNGLGSDVTGSGVKIFRGDATPPKSNADVDPPSYHTDSPLSTSGQGTPKRLLEGYFGVEAREDQPRKKVKADRQDDSSERKASTSTYRKGSGIIGDYMKQNSNPENGVGVPPPSPVVDLTEDKEDDDDLQITAVNDKSNDIVCYGKVWITINAHRVPKPQKSAGSFGQPGRWPAMKCTMLRRPENKISNNAVLDVVDPNGMDFATVDKTHAMALVPLIDALPNFSVDTFVPSRPKKPTGEWPGENCSYQIAAYVNLYGRRGDAERAGKLLGHHNTWLEDPQQRRAGVEVFNPHRERKKNALQAKFAAATRPGTTVLADNRTNEEIVEHMASMIDEWARKQQKELPETDRPATVKTPLLSHQKQALTFMLNREKPRTYDPDDDALTLSLWRKKVSTRGVIYEDIVSGHRQDVEPAQVYGGLLADVMGLGKTLEALTLVASTTDEAEEFGKAKPDRSSKEESEIKTNTKATLIICPTSTVQNWESQIKEHLDTATISSYLYHGTGRTTNVFDFKNYDIVVSTYGTVASDARGNASMLEQLKWFRIILDEAHTIREPKAQQSQACYRLHAQRRWALTGTPVQNRLSDLGSLTRFLRLAPYHEAAAFNNYIASRASSTDDMFMDRLRLFVDSFALRRLRDKIDLPERKEIIKTLEFTAKEKKTHDFFKEKAMIRIEQLLETQERKVGVQLHMLKGITTLRLICAHDRDLLKEKELKDLQGLTADEAIDLDDEEELRTITKQEAYDNFNLMAEADQDFCVGCERKLTGDTPQANGMEETGVRCYVLPCSDVLCPDCFKPHKPIFDAKPNHEPTNCPSCKLQIAAQYIGIDANTTETADLAPNDKNEDDKFPRYSGPKTKVKALLADLALIRDESIPLEAAGEMPIKSVIFSEFTSNLTLIERALSDAGYTHARIDGTMSLPHRRRVLESFSTDPTLTVLLASIKAAGQGLNLTAASRAFIMEPMWNPAAEQQAVDRVYRIGQKREVVVIRYRIEDSIEVRIAVLAQKKLQLAGLAMDKTEYKRLSRSQKREKGLKDMQSLFK
jgi:SNF2 family DNA or RNA helicase